jgi:hypothetical protein
LHIVAKNFGSSFGRSKTQVNCIDETIENDLSEHMVKLGELHESIHVKVSKYKFSSSSFPLKISWKYTCKTTV